MEKDQAGCASNKQIEEVNVLAGQGAPPHWLVNVFATWVWRFLASPVDLAEYLRAPFILTLSEFQTMKL